MESTIKFRGIRITSGDHIEGNLVSKDVIKPTNGKLSAKVIPDSLEMSFGLCWIPIGVAQEFLDFSLHYDEVEDAFLIDEAGLQFERDMACSVEKATSQRIEAMNEVAEELEASSEELDNLSEEDVLP
jgi:hypothetical protein